MIAIVSPIKASFMKTIKFYFSRLSSQIRENKKDVFYFVLGLVFMYVLSVGFYHIGRKGLYAAKFCYHAYIRKDIYDMYNSSIRLSGMYSFFENGTHSYIRNNRSGEKVLEDISWITKVHNGKDSLLCFSSQRYRGYWNIHTGKVEIPAKQYVKAWLFSEGLAAVMEDDSIIKFINPTGEVVIDKHFKYAQHPSNQGYLFKNGYCPMKGANMRWGLIDKEGKWAVIPEYDYISATDQKCWICYKDGKQGLFNDSLRLVVKPEYLEVLATHSGIEVLKEDYTRQLLNYHGETLQCFIYTNIKNLYYKSNASDPRFDEYEYSLSPYLEYQTTYYSTSPVRVGLMGPEGKPLTPPLYSSIEAVSADCFRCYFNGHKESGEGASILIDKDGKIIKD